MTKEPYHVCVSSVKAAKDLDQVFEGGGAGQIVEGRRWTSVSDMQKNAEAEGRPFLVVFSDAEDPTTLLYHAEVGKIKIHRTKAETAFAITNMQPFADPKPAKTELFSHRQDENSSDPLKFSYIFCKTPPVLLESRHAQSTEAAGSTEILPISAQTVRSEIYKIIHQESLRRVRGGSDPLFAVNPDFIEHLEADGYSVDEEMIEEMKNDCRDRDSDRLASHLRHHYGLSIQKEEVAECETVENFIDLVRSRLIDTTPIKSTVVEEAEDESPLEATPVAETPSEEDETEDEPDTPETVEEVVEVPESKLKDAVSV